MSKFYPLQVNDIREETSDCVSVAFEVPDALQETFKYIQGQHITLKTEIAGQDVRRSYSICTGPHENELRIAVKKVAGGLFSTFANEELREGDVLEVFPPQGKFYIEPNGALDNIYVAFAAGSGITPVISLVKSHLHQEKHCRFILFYGNKSSDSVIFREELEGLKNKYLDRLSIHYLMSQEQLENPLYFGRITADKCETFGKLFFQPASVKGFFLCGPEPMIFTVKETLEGLGVDSARVHFELFTTPATERISKLHKEHEGEKHRPGQLAEVHVIIDGARTLLSLPYDGENILDAALNAGADVPFACKGGVCCTCKAKVLEGTASMDVVYGLEPDEIENGFILTCQAHPRSEKIIVDYDLR